MLTKYAVMKKIGLVCLLLMLSAASVANDEILECAFYRLGECISCDVTESLEVGTSALCTKQCPNRVVKRIGNKIMCALKNCPPDFPLRDYAGNCFACDTVTLPHTFEDCTVCPDYYKDSEGFCRVLPGYSDNSPRYNYVEELKVRETRYWDSDCPKVGYFYTEGECFSCDTDKRLIFDCDYLVKHTRAYDSLKDCQTRCLNRQLMMDYESQMIEYSVKKCPPERPLMDSRYMCHPCDEETPIVFDWVGTDDYNDQAHVCPGMRYMDGYSFLCPKNKQYLKQKACLQCQGVWENETCR